MLIMIDILFFLISRQRPRSLTGFMAVLDKEDQEAERRWFMSWWFGKGGPGGPEPQGVALGLNELLNLGLINLNYFAASPQRLSIASAEFGAQAALAILARIEAVKTTGTGAQDHENLRIEQQRLTDQQNYLRWLDENRLRE